MAQPATFSSFPSLPGVHSRVSLPPIPHPSRPSCRGVSAAGGGADSNQSQAGNSSRGARPGCGSEGAPAQSLAIRPHTPALSPPPASWKLGCQPTPALSSTFLPLGTGGAGTPSRPLRARRRGLRGPGCPPPALGDHPPSLPNWAHLPREVRGAGPAPLHLIPSAQGAGLTRAPAAPTPRRGHYSLGARGRVRGCAPRLHSQSFDLQHLAKRTLCPFYR